MSKFAALLATLALLGFASPAVAGTDDFVAGVNGVVTAPFDVVFGLAEPVRLVDARFANPVTDRVTGLGVGVKNAVVRAGTGLFDIATFLCPVFDARSPEARVVVFSVAAPASAE